jgi:energy-coupling factor transporter ATP-binding protein EcfA2
VSTLFDEDLSWAGSVAARAAVSEADARTTLAAYHVEPTPSIPQAPRLAVRHVTFEGRFPEVIRDGDPFRFGCDLPDGLTVLASDHNLAGKSSVLEIIFWALRGGEPRALQADIRQWLHRVRLELTIGGEDTAIQWDLRDNRVTGSLTIQTQGGPVSRDFAGAHEFEVTIGTHMLSRLGLEPVTSFHSDSGGSGGAIQTFGWNALSAALYVPNAAHNAVLGEHSDIAGLPGRLLQVFVGLPWAPTHMAAQTALKWLSSERAKTRRRANDDDRVRADSIAELEQRAITLRDELNRMEPPDAAATTMDSAAAAFQGALQDLGHAKQRRNSLAAAARAARDARLEEERTALAGQEEVLARRFFHSLNPTICPRCDVPIDEQRHTAELERHTCAVCNHSIDFTVDVSPDECEAPEVDASRSNLEALREAETTAQEALKDIDALIADAEKAVNKRRSAFEVVSTSYRGASQQRDLELQLARIEGALTERRQVAATASGSDGSSTQRLDREITILEAASSLALARMGEVQQALFSEVDNEIVDLARRFGMKNVEAVAIDRSARLRVTKGGGTITWFSSLSRGERLRLRVAVLVALFRVGTHRGANRHPGLLMIDSPGSEEADADDAAAIFAALYEISQETSGLQVVVATARPELLAGHVPADRIVLAGQPTGMW